MSSSLKKNVNYNFNNIYEWSINKKLSIHFGEDKTESILFKRGKKSNASLIIKRNENVLKQHSVVEYFGCLSDENMSGEAMDRMVLKKVNGKKKILYRQGRYLSDPLKIMLCSTYDCNIMTLHLLLASTFPPNIQN